MFLVTNNKYQVVVLSMFLYLQFDWLRLVVPGFCPRTHAAGVDSSCVVIPGMPGPAKHTADLLLPPAETQTAYWVNSANMCRRGSRVLVTGADPGPRKFGLGGLTPLSHPVLLKTAIFEGAGLGFSSGRVPDSHFCPILSHSLLLITA